MILDPESLPRAGQILALAVGLQVFFLVALFWRGIVGKSRQGGMRPRWLYVPLIAGTALGLLYGALQRDLVFALAQCLALFLGVCALRSPRLAPEAASGDAPGGPSGKAPGRSSGRSGHSSGGHSSGRSGGGKGRK